MNYRLSRKLLDITQYRDAPPIAWLQRAGHGGALFIGSRINEVSMRSTDYFSRGPSPH